MRKRVIIEFETSRGIKHLQGEREREGGVRGREREREREREGSEERKEREKRGERKARERERRGRGTDVLLVQ